MIVDSMNNAGKYALACKGIASCCALVSRLVASDAPIGRYEGEDGVYAMVQEYTTRVDTAPRYENHHDYIDIQVIASGEETVLAGSSEGCELLTEYEPDAEFFAAPDAVQSLTLRPGVFAVFFPGDAHAPGLAYGGTPKAVKKIVGKIPV